MLPTLYIEKCGMMTKEKLESEKRTRPEEWGRKKENSISVALCKAESFIHPFKNINARKSHYALKAVLMYILREM